MATRSISIPAPAWYPSNDAASFNSARIQVKQSSIAVPSPRYVEWLFGTSTAEYILTEFVLPQNYVGTPVLNVYYKMTTAVANEIDWGVAVAAVSDGDAQDMDADAFASTGAMAEVTVPSTAGDMDVAAITISTGTHDDGMVAGDHVVFMLFRDSLVPSSDADSDAEFLGADFTYSDV